MGEGGRGGRRRRNGGLTALESRLTALASGSSQLADRGTSDNIAARLTSWWLAQTAGIGPLEHGQLDAAEAGAAEGSGHAIDWQAGAEDRATRAHQGQWLALAPDGGREEDEEDAKGMGWRHQRTRGCWRWEHVSRFGGV